jgi:hypothetical protein
MKQLRRATLPIIIATTLTPVSILGCGGSDSGGETSASLTKAQLTKQVNLICKKRLKEKDRMVSAAFSTFSESGSGGPSQKQLEELLQSLLPAYQQMSDELDELPASGEGAEAVKDISAKLEAAIKKVEADPGDSIEADPFEAAGEAAQGHGFKACGF